MNFKKFYYTIKEGKFRNSKNRVHLIDVPMFSVFIETSLYESMFKDDQEFLVSMKKYMTKVLERARKRIYSIGFKRMHSNIMITDLSSEFNKNTGKSGDVGGHANPKGKYMTLNIRTLQGNLDWAIDAVVHEWSHLYMFNHSKDFKKAVQIFYRNLLSNHDLTNLKSGDSYEMQDHVDSAWREKINNDNLYNKLFDEFKKAFTFLTSEHWFNTFLTRHITFSRSTYKYLPFGLTAKAILKKPVSVKAYNGVKNIEPNEVVTIEKLHNGFSITRYYDNTLYSSSVFGYDEIFDSGFIDEKEFQVNIQKRANDYLSQYNQGADDLDKDFTESFIRWFTFLIKRMYSMIEYRESDKNYIQESSSKIVHKYILPQFELLVKNQEKFNLLLTDFSQYTFKMIWLDNRFRLRDCLHEFQPMKSILEKLFKLNYLKNTRIQNELPLEGKDKESLRQLAKIVTSWPNSYGMSDHHEIWATAIEKFDKLTPEHKKEIIKLMSQY